MKLRVILMLLVALMGYYLGLFIALPIAAQYRSPAQPAAATSTTAWDDVVLQAQTYLAGRRRDLVAEKTTGTAKLIPTFLDSVPAFTKEFEAAMAAGNSGVLAALERTITIMMQ